MNTLLPAAPVFFSRLTALDRLSFSVCGRPITKETIEILDDPADQVADEFLREHGARTQRERHSAPDVRVLATVDWHGHFISPRYGRRQVSMRLSIRVIDQDGIEQTISGVKREDWENMDDPCPECGGREFNHFSVSGGHYGSRNSAVVMRSDFWDADRSLFTRCRECREILYKHPAFDLLFHSNDSEETPLDF